jgi:arylsulfatase A-like enzyme
MANFVEDYIQRHQGEPFFLYYPLTLPHDPWIQTRGHASTGGFAGELRAFYGPQEEKVTATENDERQRRFGSMVEYVDALVGRVTAQIDALHLSEKTLVVFTGDNGTYPALRSTINGREMSGDKGRPTDAGTHVPLIAQWKGRIQPGKVNQDLVDFTDFLPTLADVTGARLPDGVAVDGHSFAPQLRGQKGKPRDWIFCHYDPHWLNFEFARYAQDKQYKLYHNGALYDYRQDPLEKKPLAPASLTAAQEQNRRKLQRVLDTLK